MQIRLAKSSDLAAVVACDDLAFRALEPGYTRKEVSPDGVLSRQIRAGSVHVIADNDNVLAYSSFARNFEFMFVSTIAVLPEHHRRGLGSQLLALAEQEARRLGLENVSLFTDGNVPGNLSFYERCGYQETGRCEEADFSRVFFSKAIAA